LDEEQKMTGISEALEDIGERILGRAVLHQGRNISSEAERVANCSKKMNTIPGVYFFCGSELFCYAAEHF
jgi:hypothetical protein